MNKLTSNWTMKGKVIHTLTLTFSPLTYFHSNSFDTSTPRNTWYNKENPMRSRPIHSMACGRIWPAITEKASVFILESEKWIAMIFWRASATLSSFVDFSFKTRAMLSGICIWFHWPFICNDCNVWLEWYVLCTEESSQRTSENAPQILSVISCPCRIKLRNICWLPTLQQKRWLYHYWHYHLVWGICAITLGGKTRTPSIGGDQIANCSTWVWGIWGWSYPPKDQPILLTVLWHR